MGVLSLVCLGHGLAAQQAIKEKGARQPVAARPAPQLQYFVMKAEAGTYGYDIYAGGNLYIHQPAIPSQPGSRGFADTAQAGKVARLAMDKIRKGQMPPVITPAELRNLGIPLAGNQKPWVGYCHCKPCKA